MSSTWGKQTSESSDPLAAYQGKPVISRGEPNQHYSGQLIVELIDDGSTRDDSSKLAFSCSPVDGSLADFTRRIAAAFPVRVQREGASILPVPPLPADNPLADYHGKPIVTVLGPQQHYVGRVIVELWDGGSQPDDSYKLTIASDAADGDHLKIRERIAKALPERVMRHAPFSTTPKPIM